MNSPAPAAIDAPRSTGDVLPADSEKRRQIIRGARDVFLAKGFDGASMDQIARQAGVSKGTLYVYFDSKEALFQTLILEQKSELAENFMNLSAGRDNLRETLLRVGFAFLRMMVAPEHVQSIRMVIGACEKFPEFGRIFYQAGPAVGIRRMSAYLSNVAATGALQIGDPDTAASHFMGLLNADVLKRALFAVDQTPGDDQLRAIAADAVDAFLRAYLPR